MNQPDLLQDISEFKNKSEQKCVELIGKISTFLKGLDKPKTISLSQYEAHYKRLRGIKKFYDNATWDIIEKDVTEDWLINARKDGQFKEYYKLRIEFDRLEVLAK